MSNVNRVMLLAMVDPIHSQSGERVFLRKRQLLHKHSGNLYAEVEPQNAPPVTDPASNMTNHSCIWTQSQFPNLDSNHDHLIVSPYFTDFRLFRVIHCDVFVSPLKLKCHRRRVAVDKYVQLNDQMHPTGDFFNFIWCDSYSVKNK